MNVVCFVLHEAFLVLTSGKSQMGASSAKSVNPNADTTLELIAKRAEMCDMRVKYLTSAAVLTEDSSDRLMVSVGQVKPTYRLRCSFFMNVFCSNGT